MDAAVNAARDALTGPWGSMTVQQRVALLYDLADGINARFDDFLEAECLDTGKPWSLARHVDIPRGAANFKIFADVIKNVPAESFMMDTPDGAGALNYAVRMPKGVVGVICPWNLPLLLMTWKVGPALACGNAVVVKPSEETPATATLLGEVMNSVGIPAGVYNVVHGFGPASAGQFLTQHPGVDAITFTGETVTGTEIMKAAAVGLRDVSFELGGKNAGVVFADCDMDKAIAGTMRSAFANCGQVCLGTERVYVERPVFAEFVDRLKLGAENLAQGRPELATTTLGPMIAGSRGKSAFYMKRQGKGRANRYTAALSRRCPKSLEAVSGWIRPSGPACPRPRRLTGKRYSVPAAISSLLTRKPRSSAWPTIRPTGWQRPSGPGTRRAHTGLPPPLKWVLPGSTAGSCGT